MVGGGEGRGGERGKIMKRANISEEGLPEIVNSLAMKENGLRLNRCHPS